MPKQKDMTLEDELPKLVGAQYATGEEQGNSSRKNEKAEPKQKLCSVVDVYRGESKVQGCKNSIAQEPGKLGPWITVIGTGQTRAGKSEHWYFRNQWTKWMGKGEFNSDDHYIYYWGQESLRRDGAALMVNKRVWNGST